MPDDGKGVSRFDVFAASMTGATIGETCWMSLLRWTLVVLSAAAVGIWPGAMFIDRSWQCQSSGHRDRNEGGMMLDRVRSTAWRRLVVPIQVLVGLSLLAIAIACAAVPD